MTDSRKLTDNELEQVAGGGGAGGESFSIGDYVKKPETILRIGLVSVSEIVYRIDALGGSDAKATKYEKKLNGSVTTTTDLSIILSSDWIKLDPKPDWVD